MMTKRNGLKPGFTLIELMVVLFIVGILSAVAIPYMRGRTDAAKWTEGKTAASSIRTAIRALIAEKGNDYDYETNITTLAHLGFAAGDLAGRYFDDDDFSFTMTNGGGVAQPTYTITVTAGANGGPAEAPSNPPTVTLTSAGVFSDS